MKAYAKAVVFVAGLTLASAARADISAVSLGLRSGYGIPLGSATGVPGGDFSNAVKGQIPIWVDAGYRFNSFYVGGFFTYGIGLVPSSCPTGVSCSVNDLGFGVNAHYHFLSGTSFDPWAGLGVGYEVLNTSVAGVSASTKGFEFVNVQLGADFQIASGFSAGPFVTFALGQFSSTSTGGTSTDITNKGTHEWLMLGVRGTFDINI